MHTLPFRASPFGTLGVEIELQLIDLSDYNLSEQVDALMQRIGDHPYIHPEFVRSSVEVSTKICRRLEDAHRHLLKTLRYLLPICHELGMGLCGSGTHPFFRAPARITPSPRYLAHKASSGMLARIMVTFGLQLHIGMPDGESTLAIMRRMRPFLPLLIALAANSPFWWGEDTRFSCFRQRILAMMRNYGMPPYFRDWASFSYFYRSGKLGGLFEDYKDIHWDLRPRPDLGTLEIRPMDAQCTLRDSLALCAFVLALTHVIATEEDALEPFRHFFSLPWWFEKENAFRAARDGLNATIVITPTGSCCPIRDCLERLLPVLEERLVAIGAEGYRKDIARLCFQSGCHIQRKAKRRFKRLPAVVYSLVERLENEILH